MLPTTQSLHMVDIFLRYVLDKDVSFDYGYLPGISSYDPSSHAWVIKPTYQVIMDPAT